MSSASSAAGTKGVRGAAIALLIVALVGLWQCWKLERWGFDGPGAGLFPQLVAAACVVLSVLVFFLPGTLTATPGDDDPDVSAGIQTRGTFVIYSVALLWLCLGAAFLGFAITAIGVTVLIMRFAERQTWRASIFYGVACAAVGLVLFGWLLRVDLPPGVIDRAFLSLVR